MTVEGQIVRVFGGYRRNGDIVKLALAVSQGENGTRQCDRVSKANSNGSYDIGVWQINTIHTHRISVEDLKDCLKNIQFAHKLFTEQKGFGAWVVYNRGLYKKYLIE